MSSFTVASKSCQQLSEVASSYEKLPGAVAMRNKKTENESEEQSRRKDTVEELTKMKL